MAGLALILAVASTAPSFGSPAESDRQGDPQFSHFHLVSHAVLATGFCLIGDAQTNGTSTTMMATSNPGPALVLCAQTEPFAAWCGTFDTVRPLGLVVVWEQ